ncbi:MAG: hypothetical protein IPL50_05905 [Chitinophagaceae bacterium]|nr:hypothetical protein [Chitinophagaceae bacterium]
MRNVFTKNFLTPCRSVYIIQTITIRGNVCINTKALLQKTNKEITSDWTATRLVTVVI